jgi:hypothetical protein
MLILMPVQKLHLTLNCHRPWGSIEADTHVSCATGQESTVCLGTRLGSLLFDLSGTPFHIYHFPSITNVVRIHLMDCLMSNPPYGTL